MSKTFGSDEVFLMIRQYVANPKESAYDELFVIVTGQCRRILYRESRLRSFLNEDDMEDIAQIVNMKVSQRLVDFYFRSLTATEKERNAWFKKLVTCAAVDYIRKEKKKDHISLEGMLIEPVFDVSPLGDPQDTLDSRSQLLDAVEEICGLPTSAQRIIAFLLGKISISFAESRTSVSAKEIILELDGKTLFDALDTVRYYLFEIMAGEVPDDIFSGLIAKLNEPDDNGCVGNSIFDLHEKQISNAFAWFRDKLTEEKDREDDDPNK